MAEAPPRAWRAAGVLAVFAAAVLVHAPTLHHGLLTSWDDPEYVTNDPWIQGFTGEHLARVFGAPYYGNYLPLHLVSYMEDYALWGLDPFGYHLHSVLLDGVNAALALVVTQAIFGSFPLAFLAALLFAVHPSHVEAVAWVSARKDLLAAMFGLLAVLGFERATRTRPVARGAYLASLACFALGLLAKLSIATLPLFLVILDRSHPAGPQPGPWRSALARQIPYAAIALVLVWVNVQAQPASPAAYVHDPLLYLGVKGDALWSYLALLTGVPAGRPVYDAPEIAGALALAANLAGLLVLPGLFALARWRGWNALALGAGWLLALLAPVLLFPLLTYMADRYLYAPSLGFCWLLAAGITSLGRRAPVAALLAVLPLGLFAFRTIEYQPAWKDSESLWSYALPRSRDYRVRNNLAQAYVLQERWGDAEELFLEASAVENYVSHHGLALVYLATRHLPEARREIETASGIAQRFGAEPDHVAEIDATRAQIDRALAAPSP